MNLQPSQPNQTSNVMPQPDAGAGVNTNVMPNPSAPTPGDWQGFRVGSQDQHGHSERVWFRMQPGHARMMKTIVNLHAFPYRDTGELIRHAMDRHLKWLQSLAPIPSVTKQVDAILEILREEEFQSDFRTVFDKLAAQVNNYISLGSEGEARGLVNRVRQNMEDMPGGPWKRRYLEELESRFGYLKRNARPVDFRVAEPDDMGSHD